MLSMSTALTSPLYFVLNSPSGTSRTWTQSISLLEIKNYAIMQLLALMWLTQMQGRRHRTGT